MRERQESRSTSTVAHMMAPVHVTVGAATGEFTHKVFYEKSYIHVY